MLRKFVCVGFHSFPGEGAASWEAAAMNISPQITQIYTDYKKKQKNQCNLCNLWTIFFHRLRGV